MRIYDIAHLSINDIPLKVVELVIEITEKYVITNVDCYERPSLVSINGLNKKIIRFS